jgi:hypothetical protein
VAFEADMGVGPLSEGKISCLNFSSKKLYTDSSKKILKIKKKYNKNNKINMKYEK